jgi:putative ABC transport system permease protein
VSQPRAYVFSARLARREVRRRPWRTLLVALLVAGPVAGMTAGAVLLRTGDLSADRAWRQEQGAADAVVHGGHTTAALPPGTLTQVVHNDFARLRTLDRRRLHAAITDLAPSSPLARGIYRNVAGRSPERRGEVLLSKDAARLLGVRIGDRLDLDRPWRTRLTVVGTAERTLSRGMLFVVVAPGTPVPEQRGPVYAEPEARVAVLVDLPDGLSDADRAAWVRSVAANPVSPKPTERLVRLSPALAGLAAPEQVVPDESRGTEQVAWSWVIGAAVLAVVGIVIASAFAAGSRRQLTMLGLLAANGAGQRLLRRVLLLQGAWTGAAGAALGLAGGAAALAALAPHRYRLLGRDVGPYQVRPGDLLPIVALAVLAATLAALVPARTTSRTPVLNALAGRRPLGAVPGWLAPAGMAGSAGGLALLALAALGAAGQDGGGPGAAQVWAVTGGVGAVAVLLGACAVAPRYVSVLDPLGHKLRGAWRFAARSLARQRTRTAAVVSAVCVTTALALAAASLVLAAAAQDERHRTRLAADHVVLTSYLGDAYRTPDGDLPVVRPRAVPEDLVAGVLRALPGARRVDLPRVARPAPAELRDAAYVPAGRPDGYEVPDTSAATVATEDALRAYGADDEVREALAADGAVGFAYDGGHLTLPTSAGPLRVRMLRRPSAGAFPALLLTPEVAARAGWRPAPPNVLVDAPAPLTEVQRLAVWGVYEDWADERPDAAEQQGTSVYLDNPSSAPSERALQGLLATGALLFTIFFVALSLALAAAETRDERDALTVVGAGTKVLRRTSARKALLVTVLGALLGLPVGLVPVLVLSRVLPDPMPFVMPWTVAGLLVVAVPVAAAAITSVASAVAMRVRPVRVSTMAFD